MERGNFANIANCAKHVRPSNYRRLGGTAGVLATVGRRVLAGIALDVVPVLRPPHRPSGRRGGVDRVAGHGRPGHRGDAGAGLLRGSRRTAGSRGRGSWGSTPSPISGTFWIESAITAPAHRRATPGALEGHVPGQRGGLNGAAPSACGQTELPTGEGPPRGQPREGGVRSWRRPRVRCGTLSPDTDRPQGLSDPVSRSVPRRAVRTSTSWATPRSARSRSSATTCPASAGSPPSPTTCTPRWPAGSRTPSASSCRSTTAPRGTTTRRRSGSRSTSRTWTATSGRPTS